MVWFSLQLAGIMFDPCSMPTLFHPLQPILAHMPINPAFVARLTLTIRQHVAAGGRRGSPLCKGEDGWRQQLVVCHVYDNFCLPHARGRQPLPQPVPTNGTGSAQMWQPQTPAMAAGWTDRGWTLREVLVFRVPPWPPPQAV
jgi:hypothetical protein